MNFFNHILVAAELTLCVCALREVLPKPDAALVIQELEAKLVDMQKTYKDVEKAILEINLAETSRRSPTLTGTPWPGAFVWLSIRETTWDARPWEPTRR